MKAAETRESARQAANVGSKTVTEEFDDPIPFIWAYALPFVGLLTTMLLATHASKLMA